jgi:hypothetical protein
MIKDKRKTVEHILRVFVGTRDSDSELLATYWRHEGSGRDNIYEGLMNNTLSTAESITRCRRKVQELNPELRGAAWRKRHGMLEEIVKEELRDFV